MTSQFDIKHKNRNYRYVFYRYRSRKSYYSPSGQVILFIRNNNIWIEQRRPWFWIYERVQVLVVHINSTLQRIWLKTYTPAESLTPENWKIAEHNITYRRYGSYLSTNSEFTSRSTLDIWNLSACWSPRTLSSRLGSFSKNKINKLYTAYSYGNTKLETPVPVRSLKLSNLGHG